MTATATATATARERGEKYNLLHEEFLKLGASLIVALVYFVQGIGTDLYEEKLSTSTSTSDMILINVAPSACTNGPK